MSRVSAATPLLVSAQTPPTPPTSPPAAPARHSQDAWLDAGAARHRAVFDSWMADRLGEALGFAGNWIRYNRDEYGLADSDLAVLMIARHGSMPFALNEKMWTKYRAVFAANMSANDKTAHPNPTANRYAARLADYTSRCMRLAVCNVTLRAYVDIIAKATGSEPDAVRRELTSNLIGDAHIVPAGIIAVTRAQEHGYALVSIG